METKQEKELWSEAFKNNTIIISTHGLYLYCFTKHPCMHYLIQFTPETLELHREKRLV